VPYKDPEERKKKNKEYSRRWYERNKELTKQRVRANKKKNRVKWQKYKATLSCANCGFSHPAVIDFHHIIRGRKMRGFVLELPPHTALGRKTEQS